MPDLEALRESVREAVARAAGLGNASSLGDGTPLLDDGLGLDSVALIELVVALEARLGFEFDDADLRTASFRSVEALTHTIVKRMGGQS